MVRYYDEGIERVEEWIVTYYGRQHVEVWDLSKFILAYMDTASGVDPVLSVRVIDAGGRPVQGQQVIVRPRVSNPDFYATTNENGIAYISMVDDAFRYSVEGPQSQGPYTVTIAGGQAETYRSAGKVFLGKKKPYRWLNPTFRMLDNGAPVPPPEPSPWLQTLKVQLSRIEDSILAIRNAIEDA